MTRAYDDLVADLLDVVPPRLLLLGLFLATALIAVLWYGYPAWVPRHLPSWRVPRLRLPRWDWRRLFRRRRKPEVKVEAAPMPVTPPDLPEAPAGDDAEQLAAEGRYAEAIRQRLRDAVSALTRAGVITPPPGWTAAELAEVATTQRPDLGPPLGAATDVFSEIWYGHRPATAAHDARMRDLVAQVEATL